MEKTRPKRTPAAPIATRSTITNPAFLGAAIPHLNRDRDVS